MNKMGQNDSITEWFITEKEETEYQRTEYIKEAEQDKGIRAQLELDALLEAKSGGGASDW